MDNKNYFTAKNFIKAAIDFKFDAKAGRLIPFFKYNNGKTIGYVNFYTDYLDMPWGWKMPKPEYVQPGKEGQPDSKIALGKTGVQRDPTNPKVFLGLDESDPQYKTFTIVDIIDDCAEEWINANMPGYRVLRSIRTGRSKPGEKPKTDVAWRVHIWYDKEGKRVLTQMVAKGYGTFPSRHAEQWRMLTGGAKCYVKNCLASYFLKDNEIFQPQWRLNQVVLTKPGGNPDVQQDREAEVQVDHLTTMPEEEGFSKTDFAGVFNPETITDITFNPPIEDEDAETKVDDEIDENDEALHAALKAADEKVAAKKRARQEETEDFPEPPKGKSSSSSAAAAAAGAPTSRPLVKPKKARYIEKEPFDDEEEL